MTRLSEANRIAGVVVFGNFAGFNRNVRGRLRMLDARRRAALPLLRHGAQADEFDRIGTLRMDGLYDRGLVPSIQRKFAERIDDDAHGAVRKNFFAVVEGSYSRHLKTPLQSLPELAQLINDELKKTIEECYRAHFRVLTVRCWRNYHVPGGVSEQSEVFSDRWHCDSYLTSTWKLFVLLSDVTEEHGPTNILSLPYSKRLARRRVASGHGERWFRFSDQEIAIDDRSQVLKGTGPAGTAYLCNTALCLHRAGIPAPGRTRDMVQFEFAPASEALSPRWFEAPSFSRPVGEDY